MTPRGAQRLQTWMANQRPLKPMTRCYRGDFPQAAYLCEQHGTTLAHRLKAIDPGFVVMYDRCTAPAALAPGHHLYRIIRRGGTPHDDYMALEFSLQHDLTAPWPSGKPRAPGDWLIETIKKFDKATIPGDEARAERVCEARREEAYNLTMLELDRQDREAAEFYNKETQPFFEGKRSLTKAAKRRKKAGDKTEYSYDTRRNEDLPAPAAG